jgi:hypothetical protein
MTLASAALISQKDRHPASTGSTRPLHHPRNAAPAAFGLAARGEGDRIVSGSQPTLLLTSSPLVWGGAGFTLASLRA